MSTLFVFDIDATIAHAGRRLKEAGPEPSRDDKAIYDHWVRNVQNEKSLLEDKPVPGMAQLLNELSAANVMYLTSREEKWRSVTKEWLIINDMPDFNLVMRGNDDYRDSAEFKIEAIKFVQAMQGSTSVVVFDDDEHGELEKVCAKEGYTFLKARSGGQR
jgi:hypothetical protein